MLNYTSRLVIVEFVIYNTFISYFKCDILKNKIGFITSRKKFIPYRIKNLNLISLVTAFTEQLIAVMMIHKKNSLEQLHICACEDIIWLQMN